MHVTIGLGYTMAVFGILSTIAAVTFFIIMPVTKGKSVEDITKMFEDNNLKGVKKASEKIPEATDGITGNTKEI